MYSEADCVLIEFLWADQAEQQVSHFDLDVRWSVLPPNRRGWPPSDWRRRPLSNHPATGANVYQTLWSRYDRRAANDGDC